MLTNTALAHRLARMLVDYEVKYRQATGAAASKRAKAELDAFANAAHVALLAMNANVGLAPFSVILAGVDAVGSGIDHRGSIPSMGDGGGGEPYRIFAQFCVTEILADWNGPTVESAPRNYFQEILSAVPE